MSRLQVTLDSDLKLDEAMELVMNAYSQRRLMQVEMAMRDLEEQKTKLKEDGEDDDEIRQLELKKRRLHKKTKAERYYELYHHGRKNDKKSKDQRFMEWLQQIDLMEDDKKLLSEMRKKKREESRFAALVRKEGRFSTFMAEGNRCLARNEHEKALTAYTNALNIRLQDEETIRVSQVTDESKRSKVIEQIKETLIARSKCFVVMGRFEEALEDVDKTLHYDASYLKGILQKADALYAKGDFEFALVYYYKGYALRKDIEPFLRGIRKAKIAINEAIEQDELNQDLKQNEIDTQGGGMNFSTDFNIRSLQEYMENNASNTSTTGLMQSNDQFPLSLSRSMRRISSVSNYSNHSNHSMDRRTTSRGKRAMGELHENELFLNKLRNDDIMYKFAGRINNSYHNLIDGSLSYLESRKIFWKSQSMIQENPKSWISRTKPLSSVTPQSLRTSRSVTNKEDTLSTTSSLSGTQSSRSLPPSFGSLRPRMVSRLYSQSKLSNSISISSSIESSRSHSLSSVRSSKSLRSSRGKRVENNLVHCVADILQTYRGRQIPRLLLSKMEADMNPLSIRRQPSTRRENDHCSLPQNDVAAKHHSAGTPFPTIECSSSNIDYRLEQEEHDRLEREYQELVNEEKLERERQQMYIQKKLKMERSRAAFEIRIRDHDTIKNIKQLMNEERYSEAMSLSKQFLDRLGSSVSSPKESMSEEFNDHRERARVLCQLYGLMGRIHLYMNMVKLAESHHHRQSSIAKKHHFEDLEKEALTNLAKVHESTGNYEEALKLYEQHMKSAPNPRDVLALYRDIGFCYKRLGQYEKAIPNLRNAIDIASLREEYLSQLHLLYCVGSIQCERYQFEEAIQYLERHNELAVMCNDETALAKGYLSIGNAYLALAERRHLRETATSDGETERDAKLEKSLHYQKLAMQILNGNRASG